MMIRKVKGGDTVAEMERFTRLLLGYGISAFFSVR